MTMNGEVRKATIGDEEEEENVQNRLGTSLVGPTVKSRMASC